MFFTENCGLHHLGRMANYRYWLRGLMLKKKIKYDFKCPESSGDFYMDPFKGKDGKKYYYYELPYKAAMGKGLPISSPGIRHRIKRYKMFNPLNLNKLIKELHSKWGGLFLAVFTSRTGFPADKDGIYNGEGGRYPGNVKHAVTVVGSGHEKITESQLNEETGKEQSRTRVGSRYWIVENSWEDGEEYRRIDVGQILNVYAVYVDLSKSDPTRKTVRNRPVNDPK
ncbi:hypothetical protein RND81_10G141400 [Saponaria officinalis]|uniref:Peptidase C1A papain C-terminal domain-containing protein n=1 Tax=Saponaria officinalis TaxID=3572 RepID=A0AAW1I273_SAPOF